MKEKLFLKNRKSFFFSFPLRMRVAVGVCRESLTPDAAAFVRHGADGTASLGRRAGRWPRVAATPFTAPAAIDSSADLRRDSRPSTKRISACNSRSALLIYSLFFHLFLLCKFGQRTPAGDAFTLINNNPQRPVVERFLLLERLLEPAVIDRCRSRYLKSVSNE